MFKKWLAVGVLAGALSAATGTAEAKKASCGGAWSDGGAQCTFAYDGGSVYLGGSLFSDTLGGGFVRIERVGPFAEVLMTCPLAGQWSGCGSTAVSDEDFAARGTKLLCTVVARNGRGRYGCGSGD